MGSVNSEFFTVLFTNVVESAAYWEHEAQMMAEAVVEYDALIEEALAAHGDGTAVRPRGEGDGRFLVFHHASSAVAMALATARRLAVTRWPTIRPFAVRMALLTGTAARRQGDYYGPDVNRAARLRGVAHGGQVLLSRSTVQATEGSLPALTSVRDLGLHRLKDLSAAERIFQLVHPDLPHDFPRLDTLDMRRHNLPVAVSQLVGRVEELAEVTGLLAQARCLALVGPAGCGKTRLAFQAAADAIERYPDGVWQLDADPTVDAEAIARVAGLQTVEDLVKQKVLIVLDGCERAQRAAAELCDRLLQVGPHLTSVIG